MIKRLPCVLWILPLLLLIERSACQQCRICGPEQEGGSCRPNNIMDVPENITINDGMCTAIESTGYHRDVLCGEYKEPKGYIFECVDSRNSQFSCKSTCGPSVNSIGTGPEFDLLNQNGGLLLGKGANKGRGLLDFSNFQNGGGFDFGFGNIGRNSFGQTNANPNVKAQTNSGSGSSASASSGNKEDRKKTSSSIGSGDQNLFDKNLLGDLGFNSFYPNGQSNQNGNDVNVNNLPGSNQNGANTQGEIALGSAGSPNPLEVSLHKERDTDNVVVPVKTQTPDIKQGNPEKVKLVKIPNLGLKVNPSNLLIEPENTKPITLPKEPIAANQKLPVQKEESPSGPVPNDPYSRFPKARSQNPPPLPSPTNSKPQGIAVGEPYNIDRNDKFTPPEPQRPPYQPPVVVNEGGRDFARQQPLPRPPQPQQPPQQKFDPIQKPYENDRYSDSSNSKQPPLPPNYPPLNRPPPPPTSPRSPPPTFNNNRPQYPSQDPRQPPKNVSPYYDPPVNSPNPSSPRNPNFDSPPSKTPPRNFNNEPPPQRFGGDSNTNTRNSYPNPRGSISSQPANRQPNAQTQFPYKNSNNNNNNYKSPYDDRYPKPPQYSDSNSNNGKGNNGQGQTNNGARPPAGLDGSRLREDGGSLGKSPDFVGTSLLADSDYLDKPTEEDRYKNKVPEEFEKPFHAEDDIFPGFSNFANGDKSGFGTGKSVFNLFDGKDSEPPGFKNGQFNFNNKNFLKPDSYNDNNNNNNNNNNDNGRKDNSNAPTSAPSRFGPGSPPPPPRNSYDNRPQSSNNRLPNSFRPTYQPPPQSNPNNNNNNYPAPSRYPNNNNREDLIRQNERRNPTYFDPSSSPSSSGPYRANSNQNNPASSERQRPSYPPPQNNRYSPNDIYNSPRGQNQPQPPPPRGYSPPSSNPQSDRYPPSPQRKEDNSPPFNTNLKSPLNLFGGALPFQGNSESRPTQPGPNNPPPPNYRNPQPQAPRDRDYLGGNPYSNQQPPERQPYPPSNPGRFQGPGRFPQPAGIGGPYNSNNNNNRQQPPFQQSPPPQQQQNPQQAQPGNGQFGLQNPGLGFQPAGFAPIFNNDNNDNGNNNNNDNFAPGQNRFTPPYQPSSSNAFTFPGGRNDQNVPNTHVNNFINSQPSGNQYNGPQRGPPSPNNRPGYTGPPASNGNQFPAFNDNKPPANSRENPNTPYDVSSPSQTGRPNFELDFKPLNQPSNSRPDSFFSQTPRNPEPFGSRPQSQPPPQQPPYPGPPNNNNNNNRGGNPFSFGDLNSPRTPPSSYEPPRPENDRNRGQFSFDGPRGNGQPSSFDQRRPTNDRVGTPFSFDGPARSPPPPARNQPPTNDRTGGGPFSFGNSRPSPNSPPPSTYDPSSSPYDRSGSPFSFGNRSPPAQPFVQERPPPNRSGNSPFSLDNSNGPSPASQFNQPPPQGGNFNPPTYINPGGSPPSGNRFNNQGNLPAGVPFQQGAAVGNPQEPRSPTRGSDNSGFNSNALLDSSPFSFEDPTGSDQSIPSFGVGKPAPPRQQPDLRQTIGGGLSYGPPEQGGRPSFAGPPGAQGRPSSYPNPGPSYIAQPPPGQRSAQPPPPSVNDAFNQQRNPSNFGFDNNFGEFDDTATPFKDSFTSDRFSDPQGYFGDGAFTDETTQEETNQTSNNNSDESSTV